MIDLKFNSLKYLFISFFGLVDLIIACRLWYVLSVGNEGLLNADLQLIDENSLYFQNLGETYDDGWSLSFFDVQNQLGGIYRSSLPAHNDTNYQINYSEIFQAENEAKSIIGHLRKTSSGAEGIPNPHPFTYEYDGNQYALIHNGTLSKGSLLFLLTNQGTDSTWINENPPHTYSNHSWHSDSGWANVVDSELLLLWLMKNFTEQENSISYPDIIMNSLQELETIDPNSQKNFILSNGSLTFAYRSENDESPDLYYRDNSLIEYGDSTFAPGFVSIMSEIPVESSMYSTAWNAFNNESLIIISSDGSFILYENFINHPPYFNMGAIIDTLGFDDTITYQLNGADIDNDNLVFSLINNPEWLYIEDNHLIASPTNIPGVFSFQLSLTDGEFTVFMDNTITVANYSPSIISIDDVPDDNGGYVYITFTKSFYDDGNSGITEIYHAERKENNNWIGVGSSAAYSSDVYTIQAHTSLDSSSTNNGLSYFRIIATMNEGIWVSDIDSGFSVNNNYVKVDNLTKSKEYNLYSNYPNPFNSMTTIVYELPIKARLNLTIYNLKGEKIKTLLDEDKHAGTYTTNWNGKDDYGKDVPSGLYLCNLRSKNYNKTTKVSFLK